MNIEEKHRFTIEEYELFHQFYKSYSFASLILILAELLYNVYLANVKEPPRFETQI